MLPILALEIRKGKSSSLLSLSPNGLPPPTPCKECANVPPQPGGGGGVRRFGLKTGIDFLPILVWIRLWFLRELGTAAVYERSN